jgi:plasmid stabilization system protein ParE
MEYQVVIAPRAVDDLKDIVLYISQTGPRPRRDWRWR